jgi:hypothetical protein
VCAHGGASADHPPNTAAAIAAAARAGADCLELDASATADGRLVSMHARDLAGLLGPGPGGGGGRDGGGGAAPPRVSDHALASLLARAWPCGARPLTLRAAASAALARAPRPFELVILDFKDDGPAGVAALLEDAAAAGCGAAKRSGGGGGGGGRPWARRRARCIVWGKSDAAVLEVKRLAPDQVGLGPRRGRRPARGPAGRACCSTPGQ